MTEQEKIRRVLRLIQLLSKRPGKTIKELALLLDITTRTVYRYIQLLEEIGYLIDKNTNNAYFLFEEIKTNSTQFETEEVSILQSLISTLEDENPLKESIHKKVFLSSTLIPLAEDLIDRHQAKIVHRLNVAIEQKVRVNLIRYQSATSDLVQNRLIEPLQLVKGNTQLCAYDIEKEAIRHFKIKRMEDVEVTSDKNTFDSNINQTDIFGFTSPESFTVKLLLSKRAYRLLIEEFPESRSYVGQSNIDIHKPFQLITTVHHYTGIGRFILGLPNEIKIIEPTGLQEYIKEKIQQWSF
jgi:predicted DNA-binding transcriptional regulator YafY